MRWIRSAAPYGGRASRDAAPPLRHGRHCVKKLLLAALVAASTIPVTSASAEPCIGWDPAPPHVEDPCPYGGARATGDCGFNTLAQEQATGGQDTFTGGAYGYAVSDTPGAFISMHCEVRVNGGTVASTPAGPSGQAS